MKQNIVVAMCGKTHTGKTTFGKKISRFIPKHVLIDHDIVASFLNKEFYELHNDPGILATRTPTNPDLRLLIPQLIYRYSLENGYNIILTASHSRREIRRQQRDIAKKHNAVFILIFFKLSDEALLNRVKETTRSTDVLTVPNFEDELKRQNGFFEDASPDEADYFFEIKNDRDLATVENQLMELIKTLLTL